eukprot:876219_1
MGIKQCYPFEESTETDSEKKVDSKYYIDETKPRTLSLLDAWAHKAGFYSEAWFARIGYKQFFDTQKPKKGNLSAKEIALNWAKCMAYIAGADGLSAEEKEILIKQQLIWSHYTLTAKDLEIAIDEAVHMNTDEAANLAKQTAHSGGTDPYKAFQVLMVYPMKKKRNFETLQRK